MVAHRREATPIDAAGARILVVEARFYDDIADALAAGARATLAILIEAARRAGRPYEAAVALGCVIRGETGHYDVVAGESSRALMDLSVALHLPLGNGILTVENREQALARARVEEMDKGGGAAQAALAVLALKRAAAQVEAAR